VENKQGQLCSWKGLPAAVLLVDLEGHISYAGDPHGSPEKYSISVNICVCTIVFSSPAYLACTYLIGQFASIPCPIKS